MTENRAPSVVPTGRGDRRTKKGKRFAHSYGISRVPEMLDVAEFGRLCQQAAGVRRAPAPVMMAKKPSRRRRELDEKFDSMEEHALADGLNLSKEMATAKF